MGWPGGTVCVNSETLGVNDVERNAAIPPLAVQPRGVEFMSKIIMWVGLFAMATTSTVQAQSREGFWIGFGFGGGSYGEEGVDGRETGAVGYLKLGGTINEKFLIGAESNAWVKQIDGVDVTVGSVNAVVYFYPSATSGFYLKAGIGGARFSASVGALTISENGGAGSLGLGFDARVGDNWSITPFFNVHAGSFDSGNTNISELGVGVTWH